jgi:cache 3/cache 2 fusion protein
MRSRKVPTADFVGRILVLAVCAIAMTIVLPNISHAQSPENVKQAMAALKDKTASLGAPGVKGADAVAGKQVPALYFGTTKMNNNFTVVDEVKKEMGGTATLFVKSGDDFVRVATNVQKDDGSRAIGTVLDPKGKAFAAIRGGGAYYGDADILGKPYTAGYEPIHDSGGAVIGVYYVGYPKAQ